MCTGLEPATIAALAAAIGGTGASVAGQNQIQKQQAGALNDQTALSGQEFDKRNTLANDVFKENTDISRQTYDELNGLNNDEFQQRTGLSKDAFNQLTQIQRDQVLRDAAAANTDTSAITAARVQRDATRDQARTEYNQTLADANGKQDAFRGQGDAVAGDLVSAFTPAAISGRQDSAAAARNALVAAATAPSPTSPAVKVSPAMQAVFDKYSAAGRDRALAGAAADSRVASYGDALAGGDSAINNDALKTAFITDASRRALAPLGAQLGVSSLKFNNAAGTAQDQAANADANLAAALSLSGTKAAGDTNTVTQYTGAQDAALAKFFGDRTTSVAGHGDALIGANDTKLNGTNSVSQNFENNTNNITQMRMAGANGGAFTTLSQLASAITPTLFNLGKQSAFAKANPAQKSP